MTWWMMEVFTNMPDQQEKSSADICAVFINAGCCLFFFSAADVKNPQQGAETFKVFREFRRRRSLRSTHEVLGVDRSSG